MSNIVTALFNDTGRARTRPLYRYDYGQVLQINGATLPETYEVHFSNSVRDEAVTVTGNANGVEVPDACLMDGRPVYAWLYMHTGEDDGETVFHITIPVIDRSCPSGVAPTPVERNIAQEALNKANEVESSVSEIAGDVSALKSATFYKIIVGANAIVPTIRNSTLTYGISGPRVTATYRLVDGANKLIDTIETTTLNSSTAGQSATQRLLYVVWNVTTHKMEIVASLAYNAENIYIVGYYNEATAEGVVYQSPFPYYNTDYPADNKTLQDDVQALKSASLTAQQKQMLVGLFSSTANTGHASGDPVLAGTYVLKCNVATATGSRSMFTFKWVKES